MGKKFEELHARLMIYLFLIRCEFKYVNEGMNEIYENLANMNSNDFNVSVTVSLHLLIIELVSMWGDVCYNAL